MTTTMERVGPAPAAAAPVAAEAARSGSKLCIGILAHVGMQNMGDEILFASALGYYRSRLPAARFVAFTFGTEDTRTRYGIREVHPVRPAPMPEAPAPSASRGWLLRKLDGVKERLAWLRHELRFSRESIRRLRGVDMLIVPGSSQFIDGYGGSWGFPFTLLRWTVLARLSGTPICFLSLGAETLQFPLSRWMIRRTVSLANYVSLRDNVSLDRLRKQGVTRQIPLTPDLSLAYPAPAAGAPRPMGDGAITVGINPIPYYHRVFWRAVDDARYARYLDAMVEMTAGILERGDRVVLYATTQWADHVPANDIVERLRPRFSAEALARISRPPVETLGDLWEVLQAVDCVVASRYHGVATAVLMRKPVVGIAYEQKTADLLGTFGLREYSIPIEEATGPLLTGLLERVRENAEEVRSAVEAGAVRDRAAVHRQYEEVLAMFSSNRAEN